MGSFGEYLLRARESAGLSREAVAGVTRIPRQTIEALETEQFDRLPQTVFVRGFIRAYAAAVRCDAQPALDMFMAATSDPDAPDAAPLGEPGFKIEGSRERPGRGLRVSHVILLVIAAITFLVAYLLAGAGGDTPNSSAAMGDGGAPAGQTVEEPPAPPRPQ